MSHDVIIAIKVREELLGIGNRPRSPGHNNTLVAGVPVNVTVPAQGEGVRVVVISDPCFSGRWVGCQYGLQWDTYNRTAKMLNALAEKGDVDMFAVLGDNLYVRPDDS